ncbi:MAG TPA: ABC transporter ATP-binding protein [Gryllotalpicola sp.]
MTLVDDRRAAADRTSPGNDDPLLSVHDLAVDFGTGQSALHAVTGVSFDLYPGETLGIVGESGSGKSVSVMSMLGLVPMPPARIAGGQVLFEGRDLLTLSPQELRKVRGGDIGMIFQDPMSSLNPVMSIGQQIAEAVKLHHPEMSRSAIRARVIALLDDVGIPDPELCFQRYPHQYSGGMRQRVLIAMAMANEPKLLIADEPTTALDVTVQAQVLRVLGEAQKRTQAATILITHDLGLIAELADRVIVMYAGRVVEQATVAELFHRPKHPYTRGLLASRPRLDRPIAELKPIGGQPPSLAAIPSGCPFQPRCEFAHGREQCSTERPALHIVATGHASACHFAEQIEDLEDARA